ncbi:hypothetical protein AURDEDRAFT_160642 [Auricularia subglabra TFB-10046 SS5]|nr:hypothetical protein AURDEDRAFT_160642 [Auricularia subglabra TFB-10046 SS5]
MAEDFTKRLPAETLNEIIEWIDERKGLHSTAHVCRRWRQVAFDQPRRFCWPRCSSQAVPSSGFLTCNPTSLDFSFARLRCRLKHSRTMQLWLNVLEVDAAIAVLELVSGSIPQLTTLHIAWDYEALTQKVFDTLASNPAPLLTFLALRRCKSDRVKQNNNTALPRIPRTIFAGNSAALHMVSLTGMELPEESLPQFAAVTDVSFALNSYGAGPWHFQDRFARHFPAMVSMTFPAQPVFRLAAPSSAEGMLLMGRLTDLKMNESMLDAVLDDYPELSSISHLSVHPDSYSNRPLAARILERLLGHFAHKDFSIEAAKSSRSGSSTTPMVLACTGPTTLRRDMSVPLSPQATSDGGLRPLPETTDGGP